MHASITGTYSLAHDMKHHQKQAASRLSQFAGEVVLAHLFEYAKAGTDLGYPPFMSCRQPMRVRLIEKTVRTRSLTRLAMAPMATVTGIMLNPRHARYTPLVPSVHPYRPSYAQQAVTSSGSVASSPLRLAPSGACLSKTCCVGSLHVHLLGAGCAIRCIRMCSMLTQTLVSTLTMT